MTADPVRLGTRRSPLAWTQAGLVARQLSDLLGRPVTRVGVTTEGDVRSEPLATMGGTGVFVSALRAAVLDGEVDIAVHSLKDLPTAPAEGLAPPTVPVREDPRDVLVSATGLSLASLPSGARVGTGSPRRAAQLLLAREDLEVVGIRGNVDTRIARVTTDLDAVVLARAALSRLERLSQPHAALDVDVMLPAPGQGALAVEARTDTAPDLTAALRRLSDRSTDACVRAERQVLATLGAGCSAPVAALATPVADDKIRLRAAVVGSGFAVRAERAGPADSAANLGSQVAGLLLDGGASDLIPNAL